MAAETGVTGVMRLRAAAMGTGDTGKELAVPGQEEAASTVPATVLASAAGLPFRPGDLSLPSPALACPRLTGGSPRPFRPALSSVYMKRVC